MFHWVVISSSSVSDSTEVEESSDSRLTLPPADESSTVFWGFCLINCCADPSWVSSHAPASPVQPLPSLSPLARGPGEFEDCRVLPPQPSITERVCVSASGSGFPIPRPGAFRAVLLRSLFPFGGPPPPSIPEGPGIKARILWMSLPPRPADCRSLYESGPGAEPAWRGAIWPIAAGFRQPVSALGRDLRSWRSFDARFKGSHCAVSRQVEASHRSLTTQAEAFSELVGRPRRDSRWLGKFFFLQVSDYKNSGYVSPGCFGVPIRGPLMTLP
nr:hypothetical protein Iba_chr02eCG5130 [Ipomoea batatas]